MHLCNSYYILDHLYWKSQNFYKVDRKQ